LNDSYANILFDPIFEFSNMYYLDMVLNKYPAWSKLKNIIENRAEYSINLIKEIMTRITNLEFRIG